MRIVYAGTPEFAVVPLERLLESFEVVGVLSRPARRVGRGRKVQETPVAAAAGRAGLPVLAPENPNDASSLDALRALAPEVIVVFSYGVIFGQAFLDLAPGGCLNLHASLLPAYRGASPVQAALLDGASTTGVSILRMVRRMDAGPVLAERAVAIEPGETAGALLDRLAGVGADLLVETLAALAAGEVVEVEQDEAAATYCWMLEKAHGRVDWGLPAGRIVDHFRAMTPWPGAYTWYDGRIRVVLTDVRPAEGDGGRLEPGRVVAAGVDGIDVRAGEGVVRIRALQPAGKRSMSAADFLHGNPVAPGDAFGDPAP